MKWHSDSDIYRAAGCQCLDGISSRVAISGGEYDANEWSRCQKRKELDTHSGLRLGTLDRGAFAECWWSVNDRR